MRNAPGWQFTRDNHSAQVPAIRATPPSRSNAGSHQWDSTRSWVNRVGSVPGAQRQTTGVFAYGAGADFPILRHVSLRAEYRGLVYSAPDFRLRNLNTNSTTTTAQPSAGIIFRFQLVGGVAGPRPSAPPLPCE